MKTEYNKQLADSVIKNGKLIIRGSEDWNHREKLRQNHGACLLSYGGISASIASNGTSSLYPPY